MYGQYLRLKPHTTQFFKFVLEYR